MVIDSIARESDLLMPALALKHFKKYRRAMKLSDMQGRNKSNISSPAEEFFKRGVLEMQHSQGIASLGSIKPSLALSTLAVFVLVYFALWKGVKSTGKVVWVTAIAPYIVLFCLLIRGVTLDGADIGELRVDM